MVEVALVFDLIRPPRRVLFRDWIAAPRLQIRDRRRVQRLAVRIESRAVARAIPRALGGVPPDHPSQMRAHGGPHVERSTLIAVRREQARTTPHDLALAGADRIERGARLRPVRVRARHTHVVPDVLPESAQGLASGGMPTCLPWSAR